MDVRGPAAVFARVLVGVDATSAGRTAAEQAARLALPGGALELLTAVYLVDGALQRWPAERVAAVLEEEGGAALQAAAALVGRRATTRLVDSPPGPALLAEAERIEATLLAVGTHGHGRLSELVVGGVTGPVLRAAPCSVLVARPAPSGRVFPARVVAGVDGSAASLIAADVADFLARRFGVPLRTLLARPGEDDVERARRAHPALEVVHGPAAATLAAAAAPGDLLVVGSRGLRGPGAIGSVSERVAHRARSSVLVVRRPR